MSNILLIGQSVVDHLIKNDKEEIGPGGIFYSALAMDAVKNNNDDLYLFTSLDENSKSLFDEVYKKYKQNYIVYEEEIPNVYLKLHDNREREECYQNFSNKLSLDNLSD